MNGIIQFVIGGLGLVCIVLAPMVIYQLIVERRDKRDGNRVFGTNPSGDANTE